VVIELRSLFVGTVIVSKIETHVEKHIPRLHVDLHLRSGKAVNKPVQRIVLSYAIIDELGVLGRDGRYTEGFARSIILQHSNLEEE
jgi:hypothetical protein